MCISPSPSHRSLPDPFHTTRQKRQSGRALKRHEPTHGVTIESFLRPGRKRELHVPSCVPQQSPRAVLLHNSAVTAHSAPSQIFRELPSFISLEQTATVRSPGYVQTDSATCVGSCKIGAAISSTTLWCGFLDRLVARLRTLPRFEELVVFTLHYCTCGTNARANEDNTKSGQWGTNHADHYGPCCGGPLE